MQLPQHLHAEAHRKAVPDRAVEHRREVLREERGRQIPGRNAFQRKPGQKAKISVKPAHVHILAKVFPNVQHEAREVISLRPGRALALSGRDP
jgi:hypothetical protein